MRILLIFFGIFWISSGQAAGILVVASAQVPDATISVEQLADIYMLKKTYWSDKRLVVPVNREALSVEREKFSEVVFNLSSQELAEYWNRLRFQGKFPPVIQTSNQAVLGFVRNVPGAVGYIDASQVPADIKILMRIP